MPKESPKLIAHRGFPAKFPDNSLEGFIAAAEFDPFAIEMDVPGTAGELNKETYDCLVDMGVDALLVNDVEQWSLN